MPNNKMCDSCKIELSKIGIRIDSKDDCNRCPEQKIIPMKFSFEVKCNHYGKREILREFNKFLENTNWSYTNVKVIS